GRRDHQGRAESPSPEDERPRTRSARHPGAQRRRPRSRIALPLSPRIFRRPAPAYRGGARRGAGTALHRARRADQRARHADPGANGRSAARPAEAAQPDLSVHLARPARGRRAVEPADRDAARRGGRGRRRRRIVPQSEERLHARLVRRRVQSGNRAGGRGGGVTALAMRKYGPIPFAAVLAIAALLTGHAAAQNRDRAMATVAEIPLTGDDGQLVPNHAVKLLGPIDTLPGVVTVGNPNGKTALVEFYDLNCPYCRIASADIADMVDLDRELKLVLVPFPVLGVPSIAGSRVELAVAKLGTPAQFYDFHRKVYAQ